MLKLNLRIHTQVYLPSVHLLQCSIDKGSEEMVHEINKIVLYSKHLSPTVFLIECLLISLCLVPQEGIPNSKNPSDSDNNLNYQQLFKSNQIISANML